MSQFKRLSAGRSSRLSRQIGHLLPLMLSACGAPSEQPSSAPNLAAHRQNLFLIPEVSRVIPPVVPTTGGTIVTVEGKNFLRDINVTFDGKSATVVFLDDTEHVRVRVPSGTKGTSTVEANNLGTAVGSVKATISYFEDILDFRHPQSLATPSTPVDAVMGDMNADGRTDIVILSQNEIRVFLQDPTDAKKFSALPPVTLPSSGGQLAMADLDGDGDRDLAVTHPYTNYLSTWRNDRVGGLSSAGIFPISSAVQPGARAIALTDLNGDSRPDAVVINYYTSELAILLGTGGVGFAAVKNTTLTRNPYSLALADVNGDRFPDVLIGSINPAVSVFLNDTKGAVPSTPNSTNLSTGVYTYGMAVADLTGDGLLDIAALDSNYAKVRLLIGQANGVFAETSVSIPTTLDIVGTYSPNSLYLADYDADGLNDIIVSGSTSSVSIFKGLGGGRFGGNAAAPIASGSGPMLRVGDLNRDGRADALVLGFRSNFFTARSPQTLMLFNENGAWQDIMTPTGGYPGNLLIEDFDGDARACTDVIPVDVRIGALAGGYAVNNGNCSGVFSPGRVGTLLGLPNSCTSSDINLDGATDFLCTSNMSGSKQLSVRLGNGDGSFKSIPPITTSLNPSAMVRAFIYDANWPDFVTVHPEMNTVSVLKNNRTDPPTFTVTAYDLGMGIAPTAVAVGDFNKDGLQDLVATSFSTHKAYFIPNKMGMFDTAMMVGFPTGKNPSAIVSGDFNNDKNPDVAISHYGDDTVIIYLGDGMGNFPYTKTVKALTGCQPSALSVTDWNGDSAADLMLTCDLTVRYPDPAVQFLIGVGDGNFGVSSAVVYLPFQGAAVARDVTGDGLTDVVAAYGASRGIGTGQLFSLIRQ